MRQIASEIKIFDKFLGSDQVEKQGNTCKRNIPARMMEEDLVERGRRKRKIFGPLGDAISPAVRKDRAWDMPASLSTTQNIPHRDF